MGVYKLQTGSFSNPHLGVVHQALVTLARGGSPVAEARGAIEQLSFLPRTTRDQLHLLLDGTSNASDLVRAARRLVALDKSNSRFDPLPMLDQPKHKAHASVINVDLVNSGIRTLGVEACFADTQVEGLLKKLGRIVKRHGGEVVRSTGDGFVARITGRNSARRAVLVAVEIQSQLESLNNRLYRSAVKAVMQKYGLTSKEQWKEFVRQEAARAQISRQEAIQRLIAPIDPIISKGPWEMRVGVATGSISEARIGKRISIAGDTTSAAERMQSAARDDEETGKKPSRICIDEATMNELGGQFETVLDLVSTKESQHTQGRVRVYFVTGRTVSHDMGLLGRSSSAQMMGRDAEKQQLIDLIMREGVSAKIVSLEGVSGSGKSALVASVLEEVKESCDFIVGQAEAFSLRPLGALVDALKVRAGIRAGDKSKTIAEKISRLASHADTQRDQDGQSREQQRTFYAHLLGILFDEPRKDMPDEIRSLQKNPAAFNAKMRDMLASLLGGLSRTKNLVLVFDDLQKIDPSSLSLVENLLAHELKDRPITVVKMVRSEEADLQRDTLGSTLIRLGALADRHVMEIAQGILGADSSGDTAFKITKKANGNPGFAIEIATAVRNGSSLDDIPGTIQGIFESQFERLAQESPRAMQILNRAAIVGREFSLQDLTGIGLPLALVEEAISRLMEKQLIEATGNGDYVFVQDIIREAVLKTIDPAQKRDLHGRYADYLQGPRNADPRKDFLKIAAHYVQADKNELAGMYYYREASRVIDFRPDEAERCAEEAFNLLQDNLKKIEALFVWDEALFKQGMCLKQVALLKKYASLINDSNKNLIAQYNFRLGRSTFYSRKSDEDVTQAEKLYHEARKLIEGNPSALRAKCLIELGTIFTDHKRDYYKAKYWYGLAVQSLRELEGNDVEAARLKVIALSNLVNVELNVGVYPQAVVGAREALSLLEAGSRPRLQIHLLNNLASALFYLGRYSEAKFEISVALELSRANQNYYLSLLLINQARVASLTDKQEAANLLNSAVAYAEERLVHGSSSEFATGCLYRALDHLKNGDLVKSEQDAFKVLSIARAQGSADEKLEAMAHMVLAQVNFGRENFSQALKHSEHCMKALRRFGMKLEEFDVEMLLVHAQILRVMNNESWREVVGQSLQILGARLGSDVPNSEAGQVVVYQKVLDLASLVADEQPKITESGPIAYEAMANAV